MRSLLDMANLKCESTHFDTYIVVTKVTTINNRLRAKLQNITLDRSYLFQPHSVTKLLRMEKKCLRI